MSETKQCSACKQVKDVAEFNRNRCKEDGLVRWCKACVHKNYIKHREKRLKYQKKWNKENPEKREKWYRENPMYNHNCYEIHKDEHLANVKEWREKNPGYMQEYMKKWNKENPERCKEYNARCHSKRKRNFGWIPLYDNPFDKCEKIQWHHPNDEFVVAMPEDLHQLYYSGRDTEQHRVNLSYVVEQVYGGN